MAQKSGFTLFVFSAFFEHSKKHSRYCGTFMGKWLTCKFANNYQNRGYNRTNHVSWHPVFLCHKMYVSISWEIEFLSPPIKIQFSDAEAFTVQRFSCHCESDKYERSLSNMANKARQWSDEIKTFVTNFAANVLWPKQIQNSPNTHLHSHHHCHHLHNFYNHSHPHSLALYKSNSWTPDPAPICIKPIPPPPTP